MDGNSGGAITSYSWSDSDGGSGSSSTYSTSFNSSGSKTVSLTVRNSAGSNSDSTTVEVPLEPPQVSVSCPSSANVDEHIQCTYSRTSGDLATSWSWTDSDGGSGNGLSYHVSFSSDGTKTVYLTASNAGGSDTDRATVEVRPEPPDITISCSPSPVNKGDEITCSVTHNAGGAIDDYSWRASGGSPSSGSSPRYRPSFRTSGSKTVSLTARNSAGSDDDSTSVIVVNRPPERVGSISALTVGVRWNSNRIDLDSYFRDPDGDSLTYAATSDNSTRAFVEFEGRNDDELSVTALRAGTVTITVTASDGDGGTATQSFIATAAPYPSWAVYCQPDTISVYYLSGFYGTKHHLDITASEAESLWGSSWWEEIVTMSSSDCAKWPTGSPYDYDDARHEVIRY